MPCRAGPSRCSAVVAGRLHCSAIGRGPPADTPDISMPRAPTPQIWYDEVSEPVGGGWPVLEIDTNAPVDVEDVLARVGATAEKPPA